MTGSLIGLDSQLGIVPDLQPLPELGPVLVPELVLVPGLVPVLEILLQFLCKGILFNFNLEDLYIYYCDVNKFYYFL